MDGSGAGHRDWDLLVSPWHLDEQIDGFPATAGAIALAGQPDPAASELDRLTGRYRDVADAMAEVDRPVSEPGYAASQASPDELPRDGVSTAG